MSSPIQMCVVYFIILYNTGIGIRCKSCVLDHKKIYCKTICLVKHFHGTPLQLRASSLFYLMRLLYHYPQLFIDLEREKISCVLARVSSIEILATINLYYKDLDLFIFRAQTADRSHTRVNIVYLSSGSG